MRIDEFKKMNPRGSGVYAPIVLKLDGFVVVCPFCFKEYRYSGECEFCGLELTKDKLFKK